MSRRIIRCNINVSKIDKAALFAGKKGKYLDCALIETPGGEYGDWMIAQDLPRERRESGEKGPILGNGKNVERSGGGDNTPF